MQPYTDSALPRQSSAIEDHDARHAPPHQLLAYPRIKRERLNECAGVGVDEGDVAGVLGLELLAREVLELLPDRNRSCRVSASTPSH